VTRLDGIDTVAPARPKRSTRGPKFGSAAKYVQARPNRTKQNQAKLLGFAWFYSSESGLFNVLRQKNKKFLSPFSLPPGVSQARVRSGEWERYSTDSDSRKEIARPVRSRPGSDDAVQTHRAPGFPRTSASMSFVAHRDERMIERADVGRTGAAGGAPTRDRRPKEFGVGAFERALAFPQILLT
jgi:hypothetical protein